MGKACDTCNGSTYTLFEDEPCHCFGCCKPESECTCDIMDIDTGKITPNPRKTISRHGST